ncbi:MFS monocarboxylate transporter [Xylariales sp. PMI_506]|nr:MFS monocarboxylate transporter [Xylariales sp. PMI_506]
MATPAAVELQELHQTASSHLEPREENVADPAEIEAPTLPQPDYSKSAYLVLLGCVLVQAPVWGYSLAFGIFQEYYTTHQVVPGSAGDFASIGTSQNGIMYLMMPLSSAILTKFPRLRQWCGPLGLLLTTASLVASAYATTLGQLLATQGVFYAIGCGLLFCPTSLYLDEWFIARKGFAIGVMWAGKSAVGVGMPFLIDALLNRFGLRATLLAWAVASTIMTAPLLVVLKPRIPISTAARSAQRPLSFAFFRLNVFWMLQIGNVVQSLGYQMPNTYIASYAQSIGLASPLGPLFLALFSLASVFGGIFLGMLGDKLPATTVIFISSVGSALSVFLLWGMSQQLAVLIIFAIVYGFFAGGFSSTWSSILHEMKRQDPSVDTGLIFGMLMGGRGLGFVLSGPVSGALLETGGLSVQGFTGYATQYGTIIICTGLTAILGAWGWFWNQGKHMARLL